MESVLQITFEPTCKKLQQTELVIFSKQFTYFQVKCLILLTFHSRTTICVDNQFWKNIKLFKIKFSHDKTML